MTQKEKQEIINAVLQEIKAKSSDITELPTATSLNDIKSLPAMQGNTLVSAPLKFLSDQSSIKVNSILDLGTFDSVDAAMDAAKAYDVATNLNVRFITWRVGKISNMIFQTHYGTIHTRQFTFFDGTPATCKVRYLLVEEGSTEVQDNGWEELILPVGFSYDKTLRTLKALGVNNGNWESAVEWLIATFPLASSNFAGLVKLAIGGGLGVDEDGLLKVSLDTKGILYVARDGSIRVGFDENTLTVNEDNSLSLSDYVKGKLDGIVDLGVVSSVKDATGKAAERSVTESNARVIFWRTGDDGTGDGGTIIQNRWGTHYVIQILLFEGKERACRFRLITTGGNYSVGAWKDMIIPSSVDYNDVNHKVTYNDLQPNVKKDLFTIPLATSSVPGLVLLSQDFKIDSHGGLRSNLGRGLSQPLAKGEKIDIKLSHGLEFDEQENIKAKLGTDMIFDKNGAITLADMAKKRLFIDMWNAACKSYGKYNSVTGFFELNGLTDITYEEAIKIYSAGSRQSNTLSEAYINLDIRTNLPRLGLHQAANCKQTFRSSKIETVNLGNIILTGNVFSFCKNLKSVNMFDPFYVYDINSTNTDNFIECESLVDIKGIIRSNNNISFKDSPLLSLESFTFMIEHAANTSPITITVHQDVYAKLTDESNTEWNELLTKAAEKQISFATV